MITGQVDMKHEINGSTLTIYLEGRFDTNTVQTQEGEIASLVRADNYDKIIIDAENLDYISSSGLRVFLKIGKFCNNCEVIKVKPEVYEIFSVTGFTDVLKVRKARRTVSVEGMDIARRDDDGDVYELSDTEVLKVYKQGLNDEYVDNDKLNVNKLLQSNMPVMAVSETVQIDDGRIGVIFIK